MKAGVVGAVLSIAGMPEGVTAAPTGPGTQEWVIPRLAGPVVLDGKPDEAAWQAVPALPLTTFEPRWGEPPALRSTVRVAHDGAYLYASGIFEDDHPVRANSLIRDHYAEDDLFNLVIDSYDDDETAFWFAVLPHGVRLDGAITDNAEGAAWNHEEFDNLWDAETEITDRGWQAELRIPFSSLRFQPGPDGTVRMGLIVGRRVPRLGARYLFPAIRPGPAVAQFKPSLARDVILEGVRRERPVEVRPYVLGGVWRSGAGSLLPGMGTMREVGGDVKVGIGSRLTLDLTVNTDFAQTEVDDERLNLTRYDVLLPEKRQFFLEQSGIFDFGDAGGHRLFNSRTIGLSAEGDPLRIHAGGRVVGRVGRWDLALLDMQTDHAEGGTQNLSAARVRREVLNAGSHLGAMATLATGGGSSWAGGADGLLNLVGSHFLVFNAAASGDVAGGVDHAWRVTAEDREGWGWSYRLSAAAVGARYAPPLGFVSRRGVSVLSVGVAHGAFDVPGQLQSRAWGLDLEALRRHDDGALESGSARLWWEAVRRGGGKATVELRTNHEDLPTPFRLAEGAVIPAGSFSFLEGTVRLALPPGWTARGEAALTIGEYYDGRRTTVVVRPTWNPSPRLELSAEVESNRVVLPLRGQRFRGDIARLRVRTAWDRHLSLSGVLQVNGALGRAAANLRLRYHVREGQDLYFVWNEGRQEGWGEAPSVEGWRLGRRTITVKYGHATRW